MNQQSYSLRSELKTVQVRPVLLLLAATCILPILIHLIPTAGAVPIGAKLLPIFYVPLIALIFYGLPVAMIIAVAGPLINYLLTGNPQWELVILFSFELLVFTLITGFLLKNTFTKWISAPLGLLAAKGMSMGLLVFFPLLLQKAPLDYFSQSISNGLIGLVILTLIAIGAIKYRGNK